MVFSLSFHCTCTCMLIRLSVFWIQSVVNDLGEHVKYMIALYQTLDELYLHKCDAEVE